MRMREIKVRAVLNAMKSGVQIWRNCAVAIHPHVSLNAMKSGVRLCGDFNFGDVKRCLKAMKSEVVLKKKFKGRNGGINHESRGATS